MTKKRHEHVWHKSKQKIDSTKILHTSKQHKSVEEPESNPDQKRVKQFVQNFDQAIRNAHIESD